MASEIVPAVAAVSSDTVSGSLSSMILQSLLAAICPIFIYYMQRRNVADADNSNFFRLKMTVALVIFGLECSLLTSLAHSVSFFSGIWSQRAAILSNSVAFATTLALTTFSILPFAPKKIFIVYFGLNLLLEGLGGALCLLQKDLGIAGATQLLVVTAKLLLFLHELDQAPTQVQEALFDQFWLRAFFLWLKESFLPRYLLTPAHTQDVKQEFSTEVLTKRFHDAWEQVADKQQRNSLLYTVLKINCRPLLAVLSFRLLLSVCSLSPPFIVYYAIESLPQSDTSQSEKTKLLLATSVIYGGISLFRSLNKTMNARALTYIRGTIIGAIANKSLKLPADSASRCSATTHITADVDAMEQGILLLSTGFVEVFQLCFVLCSLYYFIGYIATLLLIPIAFGAMMSPKFNNQSETASSDWSRKVEERVAQTTQILAQVKEIKIMGFQENLTEYMQDLHEDELKFWQRNNGTRMLTRCIAYICIYCTPVLIVGAGLVLKVLSFSVDASRILTTLMILRNSHMSFVTLMLLQAQVTSMADAAERIKKYLLQRENVDNRTRFVLMDTEQEFNSEASRVSKQYPIQIDRLSILSSTTQTRVLSDVSFKISLYKLTIAIGVTGSGKSLLLKALLGEVETYSGTIRIAKGPIAYCSQNPWLVHGTIRDNILGQTELNERWYQAVLRYCCLLEDLGQLLNGDNTVVGNQGTALSSGQCQRIAIARALYSKPPIVILDDVFSAVDSEVGAQIFNNLLGSEGILRELGTTVVLATHSTQYFNAADIILFFNQHGQVLARNGAAVPDLDFTGTLPNKSSLSDTTENGTAEVKIEVETQPELINVMHETEDAHHRMTAEYWQFFFSTAPAWLFGIFLAATELSVVAEHADFIFVVLWLEHYPSYHGLFLPFSLMSVLPMFSFIVLYITFFRHIGPQFAYKMHRMLVETLMGATLSYLTSVNQGILIKRISQDITVLTQRLSDAAFRLPYASSYVLTELALIGCSSHYAAMAVVPVLLLFLVVLHSQHQASRDLKLNNLEAKSSLYKHFAEISSGIEHIRSYEWQKQYLERAFDVIDQEQSSFYQQHTLRIWLSLVFDTINFSLAVLLITVAITRPEATSPTRIGLGYAGVMELGEAFSFVVSMLGLLESCTGAIARLYNFIKDTPQEVDDPDPVHVPETWPETGTVEFTNVTARYQLPSSPHVALRDVSFKVFPLEKAGFVGRTGSGKSSVLLTMMNLLSYEGSIKIDGIEIRRIPRPILRGRLTVNAPLALPGTIRQNLMPWLLKNPLARQADRETLTKVLARAYLLAPIALAGGLDQPMARLELSVGETQLFSLARSVLTGLHRNSNIILLDEATSNVDLDTDDKMHAVIEEAFHQHTILTVAHRVETLDDADVVYKLQGGHMQLERVAEVEGEEN